MIVGNIFWYLNVWEIIQQHQLANILRRLKTRI